VKPGDAVLVVGRWCSFYGQRGRVVSTSPPVMVRLDGEDERPLRIEPSALVPADDERPAPWVAGD
jgi:hypothetical protein